MANIVNLTPHSVTLCGPDGSPVQTFAPTGAPARVRQVTACVDGHASGLPVVTAQYGAVDGLPAPVAGTFYIVAAMVAAACPMRADLLVPDTGPGSVVRDASGNIAGVRQFIVGGA